MKLPTCGECGATLTSASYRNHLFYVHAIGSPTPTSSKTIETTRGKTARPRQVSAPAIQESARAANSLKPSRTDNHRALTAPTLWSHRFVGRLELANAQRSILDSIFLAPEYCMYLLLINEPKISSRREAQLFLLQHKTAIDGYLPSNNRSALLDVLSDFVLEWSLKLPDNIQIKFVGTAFMAGFRRVLHVPSVGEILVSDRNAKGEFPKIRQLIDFVICKDKEEYSIDFYYDEAVSPKKMGAPPVRKKTSSTKILSLESNLPTRKLDRLALKGRGRLLPCPLCGKAIESGGMLMHKRDEHGEAMYSSGTRGSISGGSRWLTIYQGGAPGLGKRKS